MKTPVLLFLVVGIFSVLTTIAQPVKFGKSYVNISKGTSGGTFEPGDTLEIRATIAVGEFATLTRFRVRYNDTIPANTTYIAGTLRILTNEGMVFRSYTDAASDDAGMFNSVNNTLRINLGGFGGGGTAPGVVATTDAAAGNAGNIAHNSRPSFYGGVCIMSASYRIRVNTSNTYGSIVQLTGGAFRYRETSSGADLVQAFTPYRILLSENNGLCGNSIGANAVLDDNGTFGSGTTQNRNLSTIVPGYTFTNIAAGQPNDGSYGVVNNLAVNGTTDVNAPYNNTNRVFGAWDILGDHTNASNPIAGNNPVSPGTNGGYFVVVNASYANNPAFSQPVSGLCGDTYYEFSAWFRNVCSRCACDTAGRGATNASFTGTDPAGVLPNLTFEIDGIGYYTTGNIAYTGNWLKKGFVFKTNASQTAFQITIRNNAAGGGGNDWAIDDITFATCSPELTFNPSPLATVCANNSITMAADVRSFFDNYTFWRWERSTNSGASWTNTGESGTATPVYNNPNYEYSVTYPTFVAPPADSGHLYRLRIATSSANLNNDGCSFADGTNIITLSVISCEILAAQLGKLSGSLSNQKAHLKWSVTNPTPFTNFMVEKQMPGGTFLPIKKLSVEEAINSQNGIYSFEFTDPQLHLQTSYYRIRIQENGRMAFSNTIVLRSGSDESEFSVRAIQNPFKSLIRLESISSENGPLDVALLNLQGNTIEKWQCRQEAGIQRIELPVRNILPSGLYIIQIKWKNKVLVEKLWKE